MTAGQLAALFDCNAVLVGGTPEPKLISSSSGPALLTPSDIAAAALTLETGQPAGRGVTRVDAAQWQFHAVRSEALIMAAAGLARDDGAPPVGREQISLFKTCSTRSHWPWGERGLKPKRGNSPQCESATGCAPPSFRR